MSRRDQFAQPPNPLWPVILMSADRRRRLANAAFDGIETMLEIQFQPVTFHLLRRVEQLLDAIETIIELKLLDSALHVFSSGEKSECADDEPRGQSRAAEGIRFGRRRL